ncbi:MAG: hypothetical protein PHR26_02950, partial [Candidatus ainarchaeum sp.]|nr:hypothetical protein [Candidatus ainarchaeum sp.]
KVTSKYFNKFIKPNFSSKTPSYNLISEFINSPIIELYKNQKINVYGFFQEANKFVSTINNPSINKTVIDYDFSTFSVSIPSIKGTYDQKVSIFMTYCL